MNFLEIDHCLRCRGDNLLSSYPVIFCGSCNATMVSSSTNDLRSIKFYCQKHIVRIMFADHKSYIDELELPMLIPIDISDEKLGIYLTFS